MPRRYGRSGALAVGAGIARGADAFLQSYLGAKRLEQEEKLQKNAFVIKVLTQQLEDENLPYYERAKILDSIPPLIGAKLDRPLSQMMGMDNLDQETPDPEHLGKEPTTVYDPAAEDAGLASSVTLKGTEPQLIRKGDLTPALIKKKLLLETSKAKDQQDIEKQSKLFEINYRLQREILGKGGYNTKIFEGYDDDGNFLLKFMNPDGDVITKNLGKVDPSVIRKAEITANAPKGRLGQLTQAQKIVGEYETNPSSHSKDEYTAAKALLDDFEKTGQLKEAQTRRITQGVAGTQPVTPAQRIDDTRAVAQQTAILRANVNTAKRQAIDASIEAKNTAAAATAHVTNIIQPLKDEMKKWLDEGGSTTDPEYTQREARLNTETNRYNELKRIADDAKARDESLKNSQREAEDILNNYTSSVSQSAPTAEVALTPQLKEAIRIIRKNNPDATKDWTDQQIIDYLRAKKIIQ
jgi:hypothetical protein